MNFSGSLLDAQGACAETLVDFLNSRVCFALITQIRQLFPKSASTTLGEKSTKRYRDSCITHLYMPLQVSTRLFLYGKNRTCPFTNVGDAPQQV